MVLTQRHDHLYKLYTKTDQGEKGNTNILYVYSSETAEKPNVHTGPVLCATLWKLTLNGRF